MAADAWNVDQYERFKAERAQPLVDLLAMVAPNPGMRCVDLGCGTGEWTAHLHERLQAASTIGIDRSEAMLAKAAQFQRPGLDFRKGDIAEFEATGEFDLVFSNAALHWVAGHRKMIARLVAGLRPGGQIALQIPQNGAHPSQRVAFELEGEPPFDAFPPNPIEKNVLSLEEYAGLLDDLGLHDIRVEARIYLHHLATREEVVEWVKGTFLTDYERSYGPELFERFLIEYRRRLLALLPDRKPFLFTFRRIFLYGRRP